MGIEYKTKRVQAYIVKTTLGDVQIDADELDKVMHGWQKGGGLIAVRQGIINPAFIGIIIDDKPRIERWVEDTKHEPRKRSLGMKPLANLFEGSAVGKLLETSQVARLTGKQP